LIIGDASGKTIILGVTGSIAAYKAASLLRLLVKEGAEVQVVMTPAAKEFITPVTMSALSGKPVPPNFLRPMTVRGIPMSIWGNGPI
jgi:phosphopantothenoylcysteine synthetase/decarboxylase